jgi:hypothetical protein
VCGIRHVIAPPKKLVALNLRDATEGLDEEEEEEDEGELPPTKLDTGNRFPPGGDNGEYIPELPPGLLLSVDISPPKEAKDPSAPKITGPVASVARLDFCFDVIILIY